MALQTCGLNLNETNRELQPHGTPAFPCAGYEDEYTDKPDGILPWHWHGELEVLRIIDGCLTLRLAAGTRRVQTGELVVLNANTLHYGEGAPCCRLRSLVFSPLLLTGTADSAMAAKYITPLTACAAFDALTPDEAQTGSLFDEAFSALRDDTFGYEFIVRDNLSRLMLSVCRRFEPMLQTPDAAPGPDARRLARMLDYIHAHYTEDITLDEISRAADISQREALRCFGRTVGEPPVRYLVRYRLMQGASRLLSCPGESISQTAGQVGFDSPGYFTRKFRELYGCTPGEYRKGRK